MNPNLKKVKETILRNPDADSEKVYDENQLFIVEYTGVAGVLAFSADEAAKKFLEDDILGKTEVQEVSLSQDNPKFQDFLKETGHAGHEHHVHDGETPIHLGPSLPKAKGSKGLQN